MRKSLFRPTCRWTKNTDQSGQAMVEYILLMVVGISLILGLSAKFFKPVKKWADVYMGSYTQCLLDAGALPAVAGGASQDCQEAALEGGTWSSDGNNTPGKSSSNGSGSDNDKSGSKGR